MSVSTPLPDETAATPAPQPAQDASPPAEFTVRDGGPAVFARRLVRPLCVAALLYAAILLVAALFNSQIVLPKAGVVVLLILLLRAVRMAGPYLRPRTLSVRADGLSVRQGPHALSVPWQDIASVTFAGHKDTRELAVTATLSEASATRVPSSLSGAERALQWTVRSSGERAEGLESALRGHAGSRFALAPR